jgi:predicted AlkP superfamily phosphohydrolase/phosphomutase
MKYIKDLNQMEKYSGSVHSDNKVIVVGLDGATLDLIIPWIKQGKLPTIKKIMNEGAVSYLE